MAKKKSFDMTQVLSIEDIIEMIKARKRYPLQNAWC